MSPDSSGKWAARDRHERLSWLVAEARKLPPGETAAYLARQCSDDPDLRAEVMSHLEELGQGAGDLDLTDVAVEVVSEEKEPIAESELRRGDRIGPYRILEPIASGGMGTVWLAEQTAPVKRQVALKLIKLGMDTAEVLSRFEAESQALALMDHPTVSRIHEAGATPQGRPYFAMEYVPGLPITQHCDRRRLTLPERIELFCRVCAGVQHAHQKVVIHRDLKPSNILVRQDGDGAEPKIIDFGIAKSLTGSLTERTLRTELGQVIGTPAYMSPEQIDLSPQGIDTRTDIYSLGLILYELLVGALPYDFESRPGIGLREMSKDILERDPPKPSNRLSSLGDASTASAENRRVDPATLRRQLQGDLDWVVLKAIARDRSRRYDSPSELAADLRRYLSHEPVIARPPSARYRMRKYVERHKIGVTLAAASALLLAGFAVTMTIQAARIADARDLAVRERKASDRVAKFQAGMLRNIETPALAGVLWRELRDSREQVARREGLSDERVAAELDSLERVLASLNLSDVSRNLIEKQILAPAGRTIEEELAEDPRLAARLEHSLASTYFQLTLDREALPHAERAVALRAETLGDEDRDTLASRALLAQVNTRLGHPGEAVEQLQSLLAIERRVLGPQDRDTLKTQSLLADSLMQLRRPDEAWSNLQEALEAQRRVLGPQDPDTLGSMNLAPWIRAHTDLAEADELSLELLDAYRPLQDSKPLSWLAALKKRGFVLYLQGRRSEAAAAFGEALSLARQHLGGEDLRTVELLTNLGFSVTDPAEALALHREALQIWWRVLGEADTNTLHSMEAVAWMITEGMPQPPSVQTAVDKARLAEAAELHRHVLRVRRGTLGEEADLTLVSRRSVGTVFFAAGDYEKAADWWREMVDDYPEAMRNTHNHAEVLLDLGSALRHLGRYEKAEPLLDQAHEEILALYPNRENPITSYGEFALAGLHAARGERDAALQYLQSAASTFHGADRALYDSDLQRYRDDPGFAPIFEEIESRLGGSETDGGVR